MKPFISEFLEKYIQYFEKLGINVKSLILFGSQAKGEAMLSSDIDIAVVMDKPLTSYERGVLRNLGEEIDDRLKVNLFFTNPQNLKEAVGIFDTNKYIRDEGLILWPK
jgi:predicted nucleotidyltransferase